MPFYVQYGIDTIICDLFTKFMHNSIKKMHNILFCENNCIPITLPFSKILCNAIISIFLIQLKLLELGNNL